MVQGHTAREWREQGLSLRWEADHCFLPLSTPESSAATQSVPETRPVASCPVSVLRRGCVVSAAVTKRSKTEQQAFRRDTRRLV